MLTWLRLRRAPLVVGLSSALGALAFAVAGTGALDAATAGARAEHESAVASIAPLLAQSAGTLGTAAGDSALGLQNSYFQLPQLAERAQPGFTIDAGADQPDPFMFEQGGEYFLFTSQDKDHGDVPVHEGTTIGAWGPEIDALASLPAWAVPAIVWAPDMAQFGAHFMLDFMAQLAGVSPQTMCIGEASVIFGPDEAWQNHIVAAPQMVLVRGTYWLFYSGGWFNQSDYAIGVARCQGPDGPCADVSPVPFLGSNAQGEGPGEESVFSNAAGVWLLYTPFSSTLPDPGPPRPTSMAHLGFGLDGPYLAAPLVGAKS